MPVPFARRRWIQLTAAFVAGLLVFLGGVWLTNGLRKERAAEEDRTEALQRRQAGSAWNQLVTTEAGKIGTVQEGRPPVILPDVRSTIEALRRGEPKDAARQLQRSADRAEGVATAIGEFDLTGTIRDKGFDQPAVLRFLSARDELVTAIELSREAALLGVVATRLEGGERKDVLERAGSLLARADTAVTRFFEDQTEAMAAAGLARQPTLPGS